MTKEQPHALIVNGNNGAIIFNDKLNNNILLSTQDDLKVLKDGTIVFAYVNNDFTVDFYYT